MSPRFTVVIPTRNRCQVLGASLKTVTAQDYDNLCILVSDNASTDSTHDVVAAARDTRIRYHRVSEGISMTHNWEQALGLVDDGWVMILGDDDGLLPGSLKRLASIITDTKVTALASHTDQYFWPSILNQDRGRLMCRIGNGHEIRDSGLWLSKVMGGTAHYHDLPFIYRGGALSVDVLKKIKSMSGGSFFRSRIPDVYSGIAVASVEPRFAFVREPFAINGLSAHSIGMSQLGGDDQLSDDSPAGRFHSEENIPIHSSIPLNDDGSLPFDIQIINYESFLQSAHLRSSSGRYDSFAALVSILANSRNAEVPKWSRNFAERSGISHRRASRRASLIKGMLQARSVARKARVAASCYWTEDGPTRLSDVYEASRVLASLHENAPSISMRALSILKYRI